MFSKKKDLDAHIKDVFSKTKTEKDKNLKCLTFAKHYAQLKEWNTARKFVAAFLSSRPNSAQALRLQGECDEYLGQREKALNAFRSSLSIDGTQRDLVFKVCELLCSVPSDTDTNEYWCERAEQLDNGHPVVFKLKEHILTSAPEKSDENVVQKELEELILAEQKARPNDPRPKCRLLKLYLDKGQVVQAYQLASQTEAQSPFKNDMTWYETLCDVYEAYQKGQPVDWDFYTQKLLAMERMVALYLTEIQTTPDSPPGSPTSVVKSASSTISVSACIEAIYLLDQALFKAAKTPYPAQSAKRQLAQVLEKHISAQLAFHMATLLFKKAKKDGSQWPSAIKCSGPLLLLACQISPPEVDAAWLKDLTETTRNITKSWIADAEHRRSQAGNILLVLNQKKKFLDSVAAFMVTKWQDRLYELLFSTRAHQQNHNTSYFAKLCDSNSIVATLQTPDDLWPSDEATQMNQRSDLHYLIWYGLNFLPYGLPWAPISLCNDDPLVTVLNVVPKRALCPFFIQLKTHLKDVTTMVPTTPETLCQLDLDAFIYAIVVCASGVLEEHKRRWNDERPYVLPTVISETLHSPAQAQWWSAVCWLLQPSSANISIAPEARRTIKAGLEAIRAVEGQSGLQDVRLLCALARFFCGRAQLAEQFNESPELIAALHARACHYWSCAKPALERIKANKASRMLPSDRLFTLPGKELETAAAESLLYEACFIAAHQLMRDGQIEEAIEAFSELSSPYASMQQALLYKDLGEHEENDDTLKKAYFTRARDSFYVTLDRLKAPKVDPRHPLNVELREHIEEVEERINTLFPKCNKPAGHRFGILSDSSSENENEDFTQYPSRSMPNYSTPNSASRIRTPRETRTYNGTPSNGNRSQHHSNMYHSVSRDVLDTSRPREEARPSPERLDAQIRHMMLQRETELQTMARLVEASRSDDRGIREELRDLTRKIDDVWKEMREVRRENQDLQKAVKDIQSDVQKVVKAIMANQLQATSPGEVSDSHNIPDEDLYLYGEDELENEYSAVDLAAAAAAQLTAPYPQQASAHAISTTHRANQQARAPAVSGYPALPPGFQFSAPGFFPLSRTVDPALVYQSLGYFGQGALPFSEGQRLPDFQMAPPMLPPQGTVLPPPGMPPPQPGTVFSRLGSVLAGGSGYEQTDLGPASVQPEDLRGPPVQRPPPAAVHVPVPQGPVPILTQNTLDQNLGVFGQAPHAFQISMPPQAQIPTESPLEKVPGLPETLNISPKSILQSVPPPEYSSVTPETNRQRGLLDTSRRSQRLSTGSGVGSEDGEEVPEHDPCPDFQPIVPLPDEVEPNTGEEGETVLFECRAKLFRYVESEWKERGVGLLKILENPVSGKARILMRRDQVLKVCCNHLIPADLSLSHIAGNDKTWSWAAPDFADGKMQMEKLGVRFKTADLAAQFKDIIEYVKKASESTGAIPVSPVTPNAPAPSLVKSPQVTTSTPASAATSTVSLGGFTFSSPPTVIQKTPVAAPEITKVKEEVAKPSPFSNFSFGKPANFSATPMFGTPTNTLGKVAVEDKESKSLETTKIFESSQFATLSFASAAKQAPQTFQSPQGFKGFEGAGSKVFGISPSTTVTSSEDGPVEDFVPTAEFQPVVPLPELIDVKTGEEGEEILFENRAKLLRFDSNTKEWKERGIGKMKMTCDPRCGKVRLIMRREQVLKVCCNHFLTSDMVLKKLAASDRTWLWSANDYSEGSLRAELFAIKFKTSDEAQVFKDKWTDLQKDMVDNKLKKYAGNVTESKPSTLKPLSEVFKPPSGSWECQECYTRNNADKTACVACSTAKPDTQVSPAKPIAQATNIKQDPSTKSLSEIFKPQPGSWECQECYTRNNADKTACVACSTAKPDTQVSPAKPIAQATNIKQDPSTKSLSEIFKPQPGSWECQECYLRNVNVSTCVSCNTPKAGSVDQTNAKSPASGFPSAAPGLGLNFGPKPPGSTSFTFGMSQDDNVNTTMPAPPITTMTSTNFSFGVAPAATAASTISSGPKFVFGSVQSNTTAQPATSFMFGSSQQPVTSTPSSTFSTTTTQDVKKASEAPINLSTAEPHTDSAGTFSFGMPSTTVASAPTFSFATPSLQDAKPVNLSVSDSQNTSAGAFSFSKTATTQASKEGSTFNFGSPHKFQFSFKPSQQEASPPKAGLSPRSPHTSVSGQTEDSEDEVENDEGDHIHFTPVIPLPEVVPVVTGEEDEDILYCQRSKLYRFINGEWKERGIGDFKILRHKENKSIRFLMRRDQVLKICLNHRLSADLVIEPKEKDDKSFVWSASDFSEGEIRPERFALRFKTAEIAATFQTAVANAQAELSSGGTEPNTPLGDGSMAVQAGTPFTVSRLQSADANADDTVSSTTSDTSIDPHGSKAMQNFSFAQRTPASESSFSLKSLLGSPQTSPQDPVRRNIFGGQTPSSAVSAETGESPSEGDEVEIVSVQLATPEEIEKARRLQLPDNFFLYRLRPDCTGCRGCAIEDKEEKDQAKPASLFSGPAKFSSSLMASQDTSSPLVNGQSGKNTASQGVAFLPTDDKLSFANLAQQTPPSFGTSQAKPSSTFSWAGAGTPVFGGGTKASPASASKTDKEGDSSGDEGGEDDTHDPHFEPIVALPDAIVVRTGEEDEEKLFCQRAKLFRFSPDTKEWKERGLGEMKILHHKINGTYRLLLRREQVHKLVLNQLITPELELSRMTTSSNAWCWAGMNYAEDESKLEQLAVKFKNEDILHEFYAKVEECKSSLQEQKLAKQLESPSPAEAGSANTQPPVVFEQQQQEPDQAEEGEDDEEEDYESYGDDEDYDDGTVMFEKRATLFTKKSDDPNAKWENLGQGTIRTVHDAQYGFRVYVENDNSGELLCSLLLDCDACIEQNDKECVFSGSDLLPAEPTIKQYKAKFSSNPAAEEFTHSFQEGVMLAEQGPYQPYEDEEDEQ